MKTLMILLFVAIPIQWENNFDQALRTAREKHELVLLNFSGSDWCGPCISFRKEFLENEAFIDYAKDHLVLVNADFPRRSKNQLSAEMAKRNEELAEKYNKQGSFPFTLILDGDGKVLKTWNGKPPGDVTAWLAELQQLDLKNKN